MTAPQVEQTRRVATLASGVTEYEVTTRVVSAGTLPTKNLFVLKILDPENPKTDILARVALPLDVRRLTSGLHVRLLAASLIYIDTDPFARVSGVADLQTIDQDRTTAVQAARSEYLVSAVTVRYTDLATADAAYRQILSRLSDLTRAWAQFVTSFETTPTQSYSLPITSISVEDERRTAYSAALAARKAEEASLALAQAALDARTTACAAERQIHEILATDVAFLERARVRAGAITETGTALVKDFVLAQGSYASDAESYETLLVTKRAALETYTSAVRACQDITAELRVARDAAQASVARAQDVERRALSDLRTVCPTFVPSE